MVLIPAVLFAVWTGAWLFLVMLAAAAALLAIEWAGMSAPKAPLRVALAVTVAALAAVFIAYRGDYLLAGAAMILGALGAAAFARRVAEHTWDAAYGVVYIGFPCLCLVWLRSMPQGEWWTLMLLAITWSADIAAFAVGSALKGPKLWVRFSPNKTWSGFVGGLGAGTLAGLAMTLLPAFRLNLAAGAIIGLAGALATMAGDLWESMLKRRFGVKDSGDLIPGHGGLLDRVDGLMFAVVVISGARLINHLGWAH